jgi:hypothetical protein
MCALLALLACPESEPVANSAELAALQARIDELETTLSALQSQVDAIPAPGTSYTDEMAVAAVQNADPFTNPDQANLLNLWSYTDYGYQWLDSSRWTMDNRASPPGAQPRHELVQMFHETPECTDTSTFADCDGTAALKMYINGPSIEDNDWSEAGYQRQAVQNLHTHASGLYLVSFGQGSTVTDYEYGLIPPSGIHLEPWGAHQALRIDGSQNSGENIRIDTTPGATGLAIYESAEPASTCDELKSDCTLSYPLYLRGGRLHLEDLETERSIVDARNSGPELVHTQSLGIDHFYSWYTGEGGIPVHCTWNSRITEQSIVKIQPYSTSLDLTIAHSYVIVEVWGPGNAPSGCTGTQLIKTDASGVYGYAFAESTMASGGFSVAILGPTTSPLYPGDWRESDRPAFLFEVIEPL